jgi:hypothetical protein
MKKLFLLVVIAVVAISCEGPMGPMGPKGDGIEWDVFTVEVKDTQWELIGEPGGINSYYMCEVFDDQISEFIYEKGTLLIYRFQVLESGLEIQTILPYVVYKENFDGSVQWAESLSYDFTPGSFALYERYNDFRTDLRRPESSYYRVVMIW